MIIEAATLAGAFAFAQKVLAAIEQANQGKATDADLALIAHANDAKDSALFAKWDAMDARDDAAKEKP